MSLENNRYNIPEHPVDPRQINYLNALEDAQFLNAEVAGFWLHMKVAGKGQGGLGYSPVFKRAGEERYFIARKKEEGDGYEERIITPTRNRKITPIPDYLQRRETI